MFGEVIPGSRSDSRDRREGDREGGKGSTGAKGLLLPGLCKEPEDQRTYPPLPVPHWSRVRPMEFSLLHGRVNPPASHIPAALGQKAKAHSTGEVRAAGYIWAKLEAAAMAKLKDALKDGKQHARGSER